MTTGEGAAIDLGRRSELEVIEVEEFLEGWISGRLDRSEETFHRFAGVLAPGFHIVGPSGEVLTRPELLEYMRRQHGADPVTTRWVENSRVGYVGDGLAIAVFDEWQVRDGERNGSLISVTFREAGGTPNGVRWVHIHETPLAAADP